MAQTLAHPVHGDQLVRKSRFIACVEPVANRAQALARVQALREAHPSATHVCWALLAAGQSAANDDGEPSGTAGRPMLEVLRHQGLERVLATVVRYFGGVKLGAGGLVRAYTDAVAQALLQAERITLRDLSAMTVVVPYALEGAARRGLAALDTQELNVTHTESVILRFRWPTDAVANHKAQLSDMLHGHAQWLETDSPPDAHAATQPSTPPTANHDTFIA
jgi:uncharacterized YigZ family protein